jgi:hypothetical protein
LSPELKIAMDLSGIITIITQTDVTIVPHWNNPLGMDNYFTTLPKKRGRTLPLDSDDRKRDSKGRVEK